MREKKRWFFPRKKLGVAAAAAATVLCPAQCISEK